MNVRSFEKRVLRFLNDVFARAFSSFFCCLLRFRVSMYRFPLGAGLLLLLPAWPKMLSCGVLGVVGLVAIRDKVLRLSAGFNLELVL
ncbi:hypothetical protein F5H01DRAFT_357930 [Linnemannia elongata]|nr:hypothetical protein F5H01DRAFT_357930 [Linnemannia elongata]